MDKPVVTPNGAAPEKTSKRAEPSHTSSGQPTRLDDAKRFRLPRIAIIFFVVSVAGFYVFWRYEKTAADAPASLVLYGNIDVRQVNLSFKVGGRVESLSVDEGDSVTSGQIIASLDKNYFEDDLRMAKGQRDQAAANLEKLLNGSRPEEREQARALEAEKQATLNQLEAAYLRGELLMKTNSLSQEEYDSRKAAWLLAKADLESTKASRRLVEIGPRSEDIAAARALLEQAEAQLQATERRKVDSCLVAPNDGVILTRAREKGAIVNPGEVLFTLTLASPIWVRSYVDEPDLSAVKPGLEVSVTNDSEPARVYKGHIGYVSPTAEFTPKTVETKELRTDLVYRLRVVIDDADAGLRQGMPVTATISLPGARSRSFKERLFEALGLEKLGFSAGTRR